MGVRFFPISPLLAAVVQLLLWGRVNSISRKIFDFCRQLPEMEVAFFNKNFYVKMNQLWFICPIKVVVRQPQNQNKSIGHTPSSQIALPLAMVLNFFWKKVEANRRASKDGPPVASNKDLVEAAAKVKVSKKDPVKPSGNGNAPATEKNGSASSTETKPDATKRFSVCYMDVSYYGNSDFNLVPLK